MKELWKNKIFRVLCWQVFNAMVAYLVSYLAGLDGEAQTLAVGLGTPILSIITKWINTNVFGDLGVDSASKVDK